MHLGNSIICPVTGIPMLAAAGVAAYFAYKKAKTDFSKDKIFKTVAATGLVFAMQMINFAIPETGSSGHIVDNVYPVKSQFFLGKMYIYAGKTRLLKAAVIYYSNILNYPAIIHSFLLKQET